MGGPVPPAMGRGYSPQPLTGFMWIVGYYIPHHGVSTEKVNAVALRSHRVTRRSYRAIGGIEPGALRARRLSARTKEEAY